MFLIETFLKTMANDIPFITKPSPRSASGTSTSRISASADNVVSINKKLNNAQVEENQQVQSKNNDSIKFTDAAKHIQTLSRVANESDGIDRDKVDRIKKQLADGNYPLDIDNIVRNMIELNSLI